MKSAQRWIRLAQCTIKVCGSHLYLDELSDHWGPLFVHQSSSSTEGSGDFILHLDDLENLSSQATQIHILYQRADVWVCQSKLDQKIFFAFIDGSFGSVEASLQVLLQRLLREQQGLLIHASAGSYQGKTWLIPGVSGAGKSTAIRGGFDQVFSDELVIVTLSPQPQVWGTPFWSEGRDPIRFPLIAQGVSLDALTFPIKALRPALCSIPAAEAIRRLLRCVTSYEGHEVSEDLFTLVCELSLQVPAFLLSFPKEGDWRTELS